MTHREANDRDITRRIDLYRKDCFILDAKQGANDVPQQELFARLWQSGHAACLFVQCPKPDLHAALGMGEYWRRKLDAATAEKEEGLIPTGTDIPHTLYYRLDLNPLDIPPGINYF